MKMRVLALAGVVSLAMVVVSALTGQLQSATTAVAAAVLLVREQNLDGNGNIKMHEQGTASVNVTGTPTVAISGTPTVNVQSVPGGKIAAYQQFTGLASGNDLTTTQATTTACHALMAVVQTEQATSKADISVTLELGTITRFAASTDVPGTILQTTAEQFVVYFMVPGTTDLPAFAPAASIKVHNGTAGSLDGEVSLFCAP